ncbi:hypothetical protein F511_27543 [Dorcoceras hygrometricum]|uniref:C2 domain-containing protein n=1 Tax=Dorcoceras hygrometricum TaxID=472368 RepID=A0A2Z7A1S8_9LAMI|nr:hypothetical protein F511_27543 [Dorcoceras hygrometricum]
MSSGQFNAGQARGQTQAKTEEWVESAKDTASKAHDKVCETAGQTQQQAQRSKDENANFLQQTGEQVVHMAQGAIDGVKNTLGMGDKNTTHQAHLHFLPNNLPTKQLSFKSSYYYLSISKKLSVPKRIFCGILGSRLIGFCEGKGEAVASVLDGERGDERPPFDINLAVILAGFAFEAYTTPSESAGNREMDAANCQTVFLAEAFTREIYDGQLFVKLKKGFNFPAMDPWGTSDPYVVLQLDCQEVKSKIKWATKEPTWNEEFILNIKQPPMHILQVAAWDANLVTPHKRMGNAGIDLENICDGNVHEVNLELEGMGGGGKIQLEINFKSFAEMEDKKQWWKIPIFTEFLQKNALEPTLKMIMGSETVQVREFVQFAFGQLKSLNDSYTQNDWFSSKKMLGDSNVTTDITSNLDNNLKDFSNETNQESSHPDNHFWKNLADAVNQNVMQKFGILIPEKIKWDGFELLNKIGLKAQEIAETGYIESGLATPTNLETANAGTTTGLVPSDNALMTLAEIKKVTQDLLRQTDSILGALMVINAAVSKLGQGADITRMFDFDVKEDTPVNDKESKLLASQPNGLVLEKNEIEEMRELFSTAESAMEAWAMLANALGHSTFIKSEFEKICFLDNASTDTQVAIWRDPRTKRLAIAFRGTEQTSWKDLRTDLMLAPTGLNPERIGGDFKQEVQVHSGFLTAYDSVRTRLILLIKQAIDYRDDSLEMLSKWHIYVTGHSLGGALGTLLALELSSSQLSKCGAISVTMYNFGSPRVGNKRFAELYNENVRDSWRVVNHRDIIPTVPRLMGYCHVAQPIYLAAGAPRNAMETVDLLEEGYRGDAIGEATPDVLVNEFLKGERELVEKILNTEINIFRSIRDGSALMQHMEDFYYITLLENVRSNYRIVGGTEPVTDQKHSI